MNHAGGIAHCRCDPSHQFCNRALAGSSSVAGYDFEAVQGSRAKMRCTAGSKAESGIVS